MFKNLTVFLIVIFSLGLGGFYLARHYLNNFEQVVLSYTGLSPVIGGFSWQKNEDQTLDIILKESSLFSQGLQRHVFSIKKLYVRLNLDAIWQAKLHILDFTLDSPKVELGIDDGEVYLGEWKLPINWKEATDFNSFFQIDKKVSVQNGLFLLKKEQGLVLEFQEIDVQTKEFSGGQKVVVHGNIAQDHQKQSVFQINAFFEEEWIKLSYQIQDLNSITVDGFILPNFVFLKGQYTFNPKTEHQSLITSFHAQDDTLHIDDDSYEIKIGAMHGSVDWDSQRDGSKIQVDIEPFELPLGKLDANFVINFSDAPHLQVNLTSTPFRIKDAKPYILMFVPPEATDWISNSLLDGSIRDFTAQIEVSLGLKNFSTPQFLITANASEVSIETYNGLPQVTNAQGNLVIKNEGLFINVDQGKFSSVQAQGMVEILFDSPQGHIPFQVEASGTGTVRQVWKDVRKFLDLELLDSLELQGIADGTFTLKTNLDDDSPWDMQVHVKPQKVSGLFKQQRNWKLEQIRGDFLISLNEITFQNVQAKLENFPAQLDGVINFFPLYGNGQLHLAQLQTLLPSVDQQFEPLLPKKIDAVAQIDFEEDAFQNIELHAKLQFKDEKNGMTNGTLTLNPSYLSFKQEGQMGGSKIDFQYNLGNYDLKNQLGKLDIENDDLKIKMNLKMIADSYFIDLKANRLDIEKAKQWQLPPNLVSWFPDLQKEGSFSPQSIDAKLNIENASIMGYQGNLKGSFDFERYGQSSYEVKASHVKIDGLQGNAIFKQTKSQNFLTLNIQFLDLPQIYSYYQKFYPILQKSNRSQSKTSLYHIKFSIYASQVKLAENFVIPIQAEGSFNITKNNQLIYAIFDKFQWDRHSSQIYWVYHQKKLKLNIYSPQVQLEPHIKFFRELSFLTKGQTSSSISADIQFFTPKFQIVPQITLPLNTTFELQSQANGLLKLNFDYLSLANYRTQGEISLHQNTIDIQSKFESLNLLSLYQDIKRWNQVLQERLATETALDDAWSIAFDVQVDQLFSSEIQSSSQWELQNAKELKLQGKFNLKPQQYDLQMDHFQWGSQEASGKVNFTKEGWKVVLHFEKLELQEWFNISHAITQKTGIPTDQPTLTAFQIPDITLNLQLFANQFSLRAEDLENLVLAFQINNKLLAIHQLHWKKDYQQVLSLQVALNRKGNEWQGAFKSEIQGIDALIDLFMASNSTQSFSYLSQPSQAFLKGKIKLFKLPDHLWQPQVNFDFTLKDGAILQESIMALILAPISIQSYVRLFTGESSTFTQEKIVYDQIHTQGKLEGAFLSLDHFTFESPLFNLVASGQIKIDTDQARIIVCGQPFNNFDSIFKNIPAIGESLVSKYGGILESCYLNIWESGENTQIFLPTSIIPGALKNHLLTDPSFDVSMN